jgi:hypothetical protein
MIEMAVQPILLQPWPEATDNLESVYKTASNRANELLPRFKSLLERYVPPDSRLLTNIKTLSSFVRKSKRKPVRLIHDVLRAAVLTQTKKEAAKVANEMKRKLPIVEFDHKDDPETLDTGYFGSYHLKMRIADMICEVQIMPETLWAYKERSHAFYTDSTAHQDKSVMGFSHWLYSTANKESA